MSEHDGAQARAGLAVSYRPLDSLKPYGRNARTHPPASLAKLEASLLEYGWTVPMAVAGADVIAGHGRLLAALALRDRGAAIPGLADPSTAPVIDLSHLTAQQRRAYILADNRLAADSAWDQDLLRTELSELRVDGFDLALTGFEMAELGDLFADPENAADHGGARGGTLAERFGIAPFTVLSAREGWWQDRKRAWIALGIQSEIGRGEDMIYNQRQINAWRRNNPAAPGPVPDTAPA